MTQLIVALNTASYNDYIRKELQAAGVQWVKVGLDLFTAHGREAVTTLQDDGFEVMLDLKLHDIPDTVRQAVASAAKLNVGLMTIHTTGGTEMMQAAVEGRDSTSSTCSIVAVTHLTSTKMNKEQLLSEITERTIQATNAGVDGVVCPVGAVKLLRLGKHTDLFVTPGVRLKNDSDDHAQVWTPTEAKNAGSNFIVVGRPIIQAASPRLVAQKILQELA